MLRIAWSCSCSVRRRVCCFIFFFNDTAATEIYTLSLHDALPICVRLCPSFRSLFQMIDEREADDHAHAVDALTDDEHQRVVDECYQCKLCHGVCPYTPDQQQEWVVDFPRLMLRSL